jgi:RsiW-degrading membrane proteinase PrsW (M82 family)
LNVAATGLPARRPGWGYRTSLFQFGQPAFYLFALLIGFTGWFAVAQQNLFREVAPEGWVLSWLLLLLYALPVFLLVYFLDLYEREPISLVIGAFLWGAVAATTLAIFANIGWGALIAQFLDPDFAARWVPALTAPWTEEILKAAGVVLIYLIARREIDDIMDGFVYGALVGLGFAVIENVFYFIAVFGGETEGVLVGFFLRVIASGLYGHVLYTGLSGVGIAYFTTRRGEASLGKRLGVALALFGIAMLAHFLWNSPLMDFFPQPPIEGGEFVQVLFATAVKGVPFLAFVVLMVRLARRREHRWLQAALVGEVGKEGIRQEELAVLDSPRERRRARREIAMRAGRAASDLLKRLQKQQVNLAMVATRVDGDHPDLLRQRAHCKALRDALHAMPGARPEVSR